MNIISQRRRVFSITFIICISVVLIAHISLIFGQSTIKVIAARGKIAAINAGSNNGISSGNKYILKRSTNTGMIDVGVVEVEKVLLDKSGIRLIEEKGYSTIQEGDILGNEIIDNKNEPFSNNNKKDTYQEEDPLKNQQATNQLTLSGCWVEDGTFYAKNKLDMTAFAIYMDQRKKADALRMVDDGRIKSCTQASAIVLERADPLVFVQIIGIGKVWIYQTYLHCE